MYHIFDFLSRGEEKREEMSLIVWCCSLCLVTERSNLWSYQLFIPLVSQSPVPELGWELENVNSRISDKFVLFSDWSIFSRQSLFVQSLQFAITLISVIIIFLSFFCTHVQLRNIFLYIFLSVFLLDPEYLSRERSWSSAVCRVSEPQTTGDSSLTGSSHSSPPDSSVRDKMSRVQT